MGRLNATQRLIVEDFPEQKDWIPKLFDTLNDFITKTLTTLNGNINFTSNIQGAEKEFDFNYTGTDSLPIGFKWSLGVKPIALRVVSAYENDPTINRDFTPVILAVAWGLSDLGEIQLTDIVKLSSGSSSVAALDSGKRYKIRVRVEP